MAKSINNLSNIYKNRARLVSLVATAILISRRPQQLINPSIWVEDGRDHLPDYINNGIISLLYSTNGYTQFTGRIITGISVEVFGSYYALCATILTIISFGIIS